MRERFGKYPFLTARVLCPTCQKTPLTPNNVLTHLKKHRNEEMCRKGSDTFLMHCTITAFNYMLFSFSDVYEGRLEDNQLSLLHQFVGVTVRCPPTSIQEVAGLYYCHSAHKQNSAGDKSITTSINSRVSYCVSVGTSLSGARCLLLPD